MINKKQAQLIQKNPVILLEKFMGITTLEEYQKDICNAVFEHDRVAIAACHDLGKSYTMARIVCAFMVSFPGAKVITTAPTFNQVQRILWSEIRTAHSKSKIPLGGKLNLTEWKIDDDWFALGFSPQKSAGTSEGQGTASSFQGFHGEHIMVVFDEATGIPPTIWTQAEGLLTSASVKFVAIGNPTARQSEFFKCFSSPLWHKIYLSCFDSPNLKANGIDSMEKLVSEINLVRAMTDAQAVLRMKQYKVVQPKLLSLAWVIAVGVKWGVTHPLFVSKVLGRFPEEDNHTLVPLALVELAQRREQNEIQSSVLSIGVDVARFGSDKTVITVIKGNNVTEVKTLTKLDTMTIVGEVINILNNSERFEREVIEIDATGIGAGVVDALNERQRQRIIPSHISIMERHFGDSATTDDGKTRFVNFKAEIFVKLAESLKADLAIPDESVYLEELPSIRYSFDSKGRYAIESKDDFKKRTGMSSPDHSDSLALANFGRFDSNKVGDFSQKFVQNLSKSIASALGSRDQW